MARVPQAQGLLVRSSRLMMPRRFVPLWRDRVPAQRSLLGLTPRPGGFPGREAGAPGSLRFLFLLWLILLFAPQWWLASHGVALALHLPTLLFALLGLLLLLRLKVREWYLPLLLLVIFAILTTPFAFNPAHAIGPAKALILYWLFAVGTLSFVQTPRQSVPILLMLGIYQFAWWGVLGAKNGLVAWVPDLDNYDGFGPLMVIGTACALHFGLAARSRPMRYFAFVVAAVCTLGLVSSFARGAVLAAGFVLAFMLYRSPNKRAAVGGVTLAAAVVVLSGIFLFADVDRGTKDSQRSFFAEIGTVSRDVDAGTGEDRRVLWKAAWEVFREHPILGVGGESFGPFAAGYFLPGTIGGGYSRNPRILYNRKLHSGYFQILCEFGIVGSLLFGWLLVDFWRRNAALRTPQYRTAWHAATGGHYDLRWLALGLESGMVAYWGTAVFYNQLFEPWLYALLTANALLHSRLTATLRSSVLTPGPALSRT